VQRQAEAARALAELRHPLEEPGAALGGGTQGAQVGGERRGQRRQGGGAEQVGSGRLHEVLDQGRAAEHQRALRAEGLAERHHEQRHLACREPGGGGRAAALRPQHADAVRLVDQQQRLRLGRQRRQPRQRCQIAVHAEHAVGGEQGRGRGQGLQLPACALDVGVRVATQHRTGEPRAVDQAGVVPLVLHAQVAGLQQALQDREVGLVAAREEQRPLVAQPLGGLALEGGVQGVVARDQRRAAAAEAVPGGGLAQGADRLGGSGEAQVVVAAELQQRAAIDHHARALGALDHAPPALRVAAPTLRLRGGQPLVPAWSRHGSQAARGAGQAMSACTVFDVSTTAIGFKPRRANRAWSASTSGLPVVSSFSP